MANIKFTDSAGANAYVFAQNPELPYSRNSTEINRRSFRLNNGTLKTYDGTLKENIDLKFTLITESQKNSMLAFRQSNFRFYEDSSTATYIDVTIIGNPTFSKDSNDVTYSGSIKLEEI